MYHTSTVFLVPAALLLPPELLVLIRARAAPSRSG